MADPYRTSGGNYFDSSGGYVGGATYKFDQLGRIISGIGPNGEPLDANGRIVGGNNSIAGGGASSSTSAQTAADKAARAEQERLAFGSLAQGASYFNSPLGQQTSSAIGRTLAGVDVPYTQGVQDRLFAAQGDANAGARAAQDDLIRRSMAERGMEGSGASLAAQLAAGRDQSAANSQALSQIQNTAQLENWGAQERARQQGESFLASRSQAEAPYRLKEADLRSGWESIRDQVGAGLAGGALAGLIGGPRNAIGVGGQLGFQNMPGQGGVGGGGFAFGNAQQPGYAQQARQAQQARSVSNGGGAFGGGAPLGEGFSYVQGMSQRPVYSPGGTPFYQTGQQPQQQTRQPFNIGMGF